MHGETTGRGLNECSGVATSYLIRLACTSLFIALSSSVDTSFGSEVAVSESPELNVTLGRTVLIQPDAWYPKVFKFSDGRISVGWDNNSTAGRWSHDGGKNWISGPIPPGQATIELKEGEVLSLGFQTKRRSDGLYTLAQRRSQDGWKTEKEETAELNIPRAVPCGGDGAEINDGFLMDHAVIRLKDGRLMATMYGNYDEDQTPADDYPASSGFKKYRTIVVFSADDGKTWGDPITVATAPSIAQEGVCEAGLVRTSGGDILCAMRSGGRPGKSTPCYISRSTDEGASWSEPRPILDCGVWPNLCAMQNGVIVCTTGRPGNWLTFSTDDGNSWHGAVCFDEDSHPTCSSYNSVIEVAPNTILVIYDRQAGSDTEHPHHEVVGTFYRVERK